jgi:hypothetical protein
MAGKRAATTTVAEMAADAAQSVMRQYKQDLRAPGKKVVMPGGRIVDADPYLGSRFRTADHNSELAITGENAHEFLTEEWCADHPGFEYAWIQVSDDFKKHRQAGIAHSRIGQDIYIPVPKDAIRRDCGLPFSTHTTPSGEKLCQVYDVALVAVSPDNWEHYFREKERAGVQAVAGNIDRFYSGIENSDPGAGAIGATAEVTHNRVSRT